MTTRARSGLIAAACLSLALAAPAAAQAPGAAQVHVGPLAGYSLLQHTDTSLSHGPLHDEATVGRTWLLGAVLDARLTDRDVVSVEFLAGPYHNDEDHYCISYYDGSCTPGAGSRTSSVVIVDLQYTRLFGRSPWRPYVGGGFGLKRYGFEDTWSEPVTSAAVLMTGGVRTSGRRPVRLEVTALLVPHHPILNNHTQFELQARVVALAF